MRHPVSSFVPSQAIGAAVDGYERGDIAKIYTKTNVRAMLSAGFQPITYRLRTELAVEAWHWNPRGRWSDPKSKSGYWTSSSNLGSRISICNGYRLPRRGDTYDQANNAGYSRIDDGNARTFWKSNPYLSKPFAPEDHPQWIVVELGSPTPIDTIRLSWGEPYATKFDVEYWSPAPDPHPDVPYVPGHIDATLYQEGEWRRFPNGRVEAGRDGVSTIRLSRSPIACPLIRIMLRSSSGNSSGRDLRDRLGYAVRELYLGTTDTAGRFHDILRHGKSNKSQSVVYVSSTDPWHRSTDIDRDVEQPGFDQIFRNGLTRGLPVMMPVGLAYDTPENAVAEIKYLRGRGYAVGKVEMGEEPDGQYFTPEDYGALYVEWAKALHRYDPRLQLGGPCYQTMAWREAAWADSGRSSSWTRRFIDYLTSHHALKDLSFFSSEFYFYNDVCSPPEPKLVKMPLLVDAAFKRWRDDGVPASIPWYATEYGYSPYAAEAEVDVPGALLDADLIGHFLTIGGAGLYFYGIEPNTPISEVPCGSYGNLALWRSDDDRNIIAPYAAYWVAKLVTWEWSTVGSGRVYVYPATSMSPAVTAYAARRPDGSRSVMLINKSATKTVDVRLDLDGEYRDGDGMPIQGSGHGTRTVIQYSRRNYVWHAAGESGYAMPNRPPDRWTVKDLQSTIVLPPYSITIVRN